MGTQEREDRKKKRKNKLYIVLLMDKVGIFDIGHCSLREALINLYTKMGKEKGVGSKPTQRVNVKISKGLKSDIQYRLHLPQTWRFVYAIKSRHPSSTPSSS